MAAELPPRRLRLSRQMRLKQSRDFSRIRREGRRLACGCFIANWQILPGAATARLGVITAKKLGSAPVRTRARRLLREVFRLHQHDLTQPVDMVLVAQRTIVGSGRAGVEEAYMNMLRKAGLLKTA